MATLRLKVNDLRIGFHTGKQIRTVVDGVSFELYAGEMLALLGESGSGKSLTALALMGLLPRPSAELLSGSACYNGEAELLAMDDEQLRKFRGRHIAMIFQEPMTALNPVMTIGAQLAEVLQTHFNFTKREIQQRCIALMREVEIPEPEARLLSYPHELSGGQRQRVMIAMALAGEPEILIADEPTTALDVTVQAQIMQLIDKLRISRGMSVLFITHNLALAAQSAQRCAVMYAGQIVECADTISIFHHPRHPYTRLLQRARPTLQIRGIPLETIHGSVPRDWSCLNGCRFAPRCPVAQVQCNQHAPQLQPCGDAHHLVRCHLAAQPCAFAPNISISHAADVANSESGREDEVLRTEDLRVWFPLRKEGLFAKRGILKAVDGVSLCLQRGKTLALVGESGCGKSTIGKTLMQILHPTSGKIFLDRDQEITASHAQLKQLRRKVQMIFQDPASSLDPRMMVGDSIAEGMALADPPMNAKQRSDRVAELLELCGLQRSDALRYPHQFSGGQRQRIGLARALAANPQVVICDECTSALDVSVQAQILNLLKAIQERTQVAYLFITHDLSVVGYIADRVAVMRQGKIIEEAPTEQLFAAPQQAYTRTLLNAAPMF